MSQEVKDIREQLTRDLEKSLIYFANRQNKMLSAAAATAIAKRVMEKIDLDNAAFQHKGTSWLAGLIIDNFPVPTAEVKP
ncbi:hypothetical protein [Planococcus alpniumensis]|uniref:hypothetical protein n=1 Tax=Planococcus alpniumensis TaxID=2708345 RepID=UPI001B8BE96F|nr:hypothetical protein [Planococcus sp. MSAK28401]